MRAGDSRETSQETIKVLSIVQRNAAIATCSCNYNIANYYTEMFMCVVHSTLG